MTPKRFNPEEDFAPIPFDERICRLAAELKRLGLNWQPHVGCFVWDPEAFIKVDSPFPERIYFILSLPRFVDIFGGVAEIAEKLVWLPTWHQARLLCTQLGVNNQAIADIWRGKQDVAAGGEMLHIYQLLIDTLQKQIP
jgi:hypothetical protein